MPQKEKKRTNRPHAKKGRKKKKKKSTTKKDSSFDVLLKAKGRLRSAMALLDEVTHLLDEVVRIKIAGELEDLVRRIK